ncbi:MAG: GTP-binding protein [Verrucomicrobiales bacterium]|nr:GTP-binding protein [Verrucomicrobiales bacterium]
MIKKKVCLIGAYAVGKTSLVRKYVDGIFSDEYLTTVGVKIDQRQENIDGTDILLMVWDIAGRDEVQPVQKSFLTRTDAFIYVIDGTRRETLDAVRVEMAEIRNDYPDAVSILLANKYDLTEEWELEENEPAFEELRGEGLEILLTSAKTGENVAEAFATVARLAVRESNE